LVLAIGAVAVLAEHVSRPNRAEWMRTAKWGVMGHYLADWRAKVDHAPMSVVKWNELIDKFDVETLAEQLASAGAGYYQITIGQNSGFYLAPNATYDKITGIHPSKCSRRDLVADLYQALHKRGIRLMVYLPSGAPNADAAAVKALEWRNGPYPNHEFQQKWEAIIREWSQRWGDKVSGWWFDGCYFPSSMYRSPSPPNFTTLAASARTGNPAAALAFNPGVFYRQFSLTPDEDFLAGEVDHPERLQLRRSDDGKVDGAQIQMLSFLGETWGMGSPRFTTEEVVKYSRELWDARGAVTWDVPLQLNGTIAQPFLDQLAALKSR
jgi:hypothetical protein